MFGYVLPVKEEMKMRDFETYRSSYCGVCKQLQKSYGVFSRFLLNYDLVLVSVIADALSGEVGEVRCEGCFANPLAKRCTQHQTNGLELGADGLIMLSYHKLCDNIADEKFGKYLLYSALKLFMRRMYKKAANRRPDIALILTEQMALQQLLEQEKCNSIDQACDPTAKMCEAIFKAAGKTENEQRILARLGLFAGQIVYLLDAAEDFEHDIKQRHYNVFFELGYTQAQVVETTQRRCRMAAGEIALCYNLLNIKQHKEILDNIFFLGLPAGIGNAGVKRTKRRPKHGQIESI